MTGAAIPCPGAIITRRAEVLEAESADARVLASVESGRIADLNPVAAEIWTLLARPISFAALCDALACRYDAPRTVLEADVAAFLAHLKAMAMVDIEGE